MAIDPDKANLDPQAKALLDFIAQAGRIPYSQITPPQARAQYVELCRRTRKPGEWAVDATNIAVPGPGGQLRARLYRPRAAGAAVLSLDYRLAPEHRFPAAVEDCVAAVEFAARDGHRLGLDPTRLAVGGDSAGGNLAAVAALAARDAGMALKGQLLIYPATDFAGGTASHEDYAEGFLLTREAVAWFSANYVEPARHGDWRVSPLSASDLARLPPALVIVGECDVLRDESRAYAEALGRAGNAASLHIYPGMIHGFFTMGGIIAAADRAMAHAAAILKPAFAR